MLHTYSGHNFHGYYSLKLRAPKVGGKLTKRQLTTIDRVLCGMSDCTCGGGYGDGPDSDSARIANDGVLHPAGCTCNDCC